MANTKRTEPVILVFDMDSNRLHWLEQTALREQTVSELAHDLLHNISLEFQSDHSPLSDPDDSPRLAANEG
jgi:hypothetical protein